MLAPHLSWQAQIAEMLRLSRTFGLFNATVICVEPRIKKPFVDFARRVCPGLKAAQIRSAGGSEPAFRQSRSPCDRFI